MSHKKGQVCPAFVHANSSSVFPPLWCCSLINGDVLDLSEKNAELSDLFTNPVFRWSFMANQSAREGHAATGALRVCD
jgi:hypothetical protein